METTKKKEVCRKKKYKICMNGPPKMKQYQFNKRGSEGEKEAHLKINEFICSHGLMGNSDYVNYHLSLGFYYIYFIDAMKFANMVDGGEVFDETEVSIIISNLKMAKNVFLSFKAKLGIEIAPFDTAETIIMEECSIEKGEFIGNREIALANAKEWLRRFKRKGEIPYKEGYVEASVSQAFFLYEVAVYIHYLLDADMNYEFLGDKKGEVLNET